MYLGVLGVIAKKYWGWEGFRQTCRQKKLQCGVLSPSIAKGPKHKKNTGGGSAELTQERGSGQGCTAHAS